MYLLKSVNSIDTYRAPMCEFRSEFPTAPRLARPRALTPRSECLFPHGSPLRGAHNSIVSTYRGQIQSSKHPPNFPQLEREGISGGGLISYLYTATPLRFLALGVGLSEDTISLRTDTCRSAEGASVIDVSIKYRDYRR